MSSSWFRSVLALSLFVLVLAGPAAALHQYYEQNGDCYVLICDGPYRGAYALNNLTGGAVQKIWDLEDSDGQDLDAYGIAATQQWDGSAPQKKLYVFAGIDTAPQDWYGMISRRVIVWPDATGVYSEAVDRIIHRYHDPGSPGDSPTGRGNHCASDYCQSLPNIFGGTCYPCSIVPDPTPGKSGYYDVPAGQWYHSLDHPVWSPYTYGWGSGGGGGWVHYVCRENVKVTFRDIKLHLLERNTGVVDPDDFPSDVAYVKTSENSTLDQRGECVDGCITANDGLTGPAGEIPYLDCSYSSIGKSYLYRREPTLTEYTLVGKDGDTTLVGEPSNLTTTSIGVSSKDTAGDFVYVVGTDVINSWLTAAGAPYSIATLTDFAVSDQWWSTGGIAYAYDKTQRTVYKFVRNDKLGTTPIPEQINVGLDGFLPDSIGADGFGHLYLMKTRMDPADTSTWTPADAYTYWQTWTDFFGNKYGRAFFTQGVYKTVYKRNYYTRETSPISGDIVLGTNTFLRDFIVPAGQNFNDKANWQWNGGFAQIGTPVETEYEVKIAVINSATPPQVEGNRTGLCDVRGPLLFSSDTGAFNPAPADEEGKYTDENVYFFEVENFPRFDTNEVNTWSGDDIDGDGRRGQFVSTVKKSTMQYYWKVIKVKDGNGGAVNTTILDQTLTAPGSYRFSAVLPAGEYWVGVKTVFHYYDYDLLLPGSLANDKESVLVGPRTAVGDTHYPNGEIIADNSGYSWVSINIKGWNPPPEGDSVIMSGKFSPATGFTYKPDNTDSFGALGYPKYVIPDQAVQDWSFKLRDNLENRTNHPTEGRLTIMNEAKPPIPAGIVKIVPDTNVWTDPSPQYSWESLLKRGDDTIIEVPPLTTSGPELSAAETKRLFPAPSQPKAYTLKATARRVGTVQAYFPTPIIYPDGNIGTDWGEPTDVPIIVQMSAMCEVIVKDLTGPQISYPNPLDVGTASGVFVNREFLYGTTGETIASPTSPPVVTPQNLIFVVADNNPMGNDPTTLAYSDPYHNDPTTNDLSVNHTYSARYAELYYPTVPERSEITPATYYRSNSTQNDNTNSEYKLQQKDLVESDFETGDLDWLPKEKYNKAFSYRMYKIPLADLAHFSDQGAPLKLDLANSVSTYKNPIFGLVVKDASEIGPSSSNEADYIGRGEIVIRDNDRPTAFIQAQELKHEGVVHLIPSNLSTTLLGQWLRLAHPPTSESEMNGAQAWTGTNIGGIDDGLKVDPARPVSAVLTTPAAEFEVDVPAFFHPIHFDNMGETVINKFSLFDLDGTTVLDNRPTGEDIRYLFRQPSTATAKYTVNLEVSDNARGWPSNPRDPFNTADLDNTTKNTRSLTLQLDVYASRLDIRVIDRSNQGK